MGISECKAQRYDITTLQLYQLYIYIPKYINNMENNFRDRNIRISCPVTSTFKNVHFLEHLINYSDNKGDLIHRFTPIYIAQLIPICMLEEWSKFFIGQNSKISEEQFIALFGTAVPHTRHQTLFLILGLREIYKQIKTKHKMNINQQQIQFNWITDFLCEKITNNQQDAKIQIRASQQYQQFSNGQKYPTIKYLFQQSQPYAFKQQSNKEKSLKNNLNKIRYSPKLQLIFSLTNIDNKIQIYDLQLKIKGTISLKNNKQIIILSFAYSQQHQRICCLIHNVGLVFWEASDNFETKKVIGDVKADFIFYLSHYQLWGSVKTNKISIWDIYQAKQSYSLNIEEASQICCVEQLSHIKLTLISIILKSKKRQLRIYEMNGSKARQLSKIQISNSGCHTLIVNFATQSILQIGYSNNIKVWECDNLTYELMFMGELVGHRAIVVSAANVGLSSIVVTGDDKGFIKLWDLKHLRCYQTLRLSTKEICQLINIEDKLVYGDNRISFLSFDAKKAERGERFYTNSFYDQRKQYMYVFTQDSCSVVSMNNGEVQQIFIICDVDEQIVGVQQMTINFLIATNKGNIIIADRQFKRKKTLKINECGIVNLISVSLNNCILVLAGDGSLTVWIFDSFNQSIQLRKTLTNLPVKKISSNSIFQVSHRNNILSCCFNDNYVFIGNFQLLKFHYKLIFPSNVSSFKFHSNFDLLIVCCQNGQIFTLQFKKQQHQQYQIKKIHSNYCQFFNITQNQNNQHSKLQQNEYICKMMINKIGQLVGGTNFGSVQIYDLQKYLKQIDISTIVDRNIKKSQANLFRPINQIFLGPLQQKQIKQIDIRKNCLYPNKSISIITEKKHLGNKKQVIYLDDSRQIGIITSISSDGILRLFNYKNLQVLCLRKQGQRNPICWKKPNIDTNILKNNLIDTLKITQNVYNRKYRPQIQNCISLQKLNITNFLSALATLQLDSIQKKSELNQLNDKKKNRIKHKSVFSSEDLKFKTIQIDKRIRKKSCVLNTSNKYQTDQDIGLINRKLKQTAVILQKKQSPFHDQFFKKSLKRKMKQQEQMKMDGQCIIYDKINQKFQKWKQDKKLRSLTNFANNGNTLSKQQVLRDSQIILMKNKIDTHNILKSKMETLYYKKDKKSQALKKLLRRKCSHLFDKMK